MATLKAEGPRRFDRRVKLLKPGIPTLSEDNPYNEKDIDYTVAYPSYPARRLDSLTEIDEKDTANLVRSISEVEWELQWSPKLPVTASWRIQDLYDGQVYEITSPVTENGRGVSYRAITSIVQ